MLGQDISVYPGTEPTEKLISQSDSRRGWRTNPETALESLARSLEEMDEAEITPYLDRLHRLKEEMMELSEG
jgi:hypothetical protein